jgi:hypothetical protein
MKKIFQEIIELDHVKGCLYITKEGHVAHSHFLSPPAISVESHNWQTFIKVLGNISEAEILFEKSRIFMRKTNTGYLLILVEPYAILSLMKLQCDIFVQKLNDYKPTGLSRFFNK